MKKIILFIAVAFSFSLAAQKAAPAAKAPANWFNLAYSTDKVHGVRTEQTYKDLVKDKKADTIIVAVMDGGVDYMHEDLKSVMWRNPGEIPGNKIDDDKNGYIDDIYGWNFIGGANGENVQYDNLEFIRLLRPLQKKYQGVNESTVQPSQKEEYEKFVKLREKYNTELAINQFYFDQYSASKKAVDAFKDEIKKQLDIDSVLYEDILKYSPTGKFINTKTNIIAYYGNEENWAALNEGLSEGYAQTYAAINYQLNLDYDPRSIVGDNYDNADERYYGNADVKGPDALHGTHVAGIIAANRFNNIGTFGVATPVKIMAIRVVPNGDERDKDVANGIRYAVDNGARIINMSFGKAYSYDKGAVDAAVKYAESKGVLIIHAAGNSSQNNDENENFPNSKFNGGGTATNWIEVGALSWRDNRDLVAPFSNYGKTAVDVFAPGVDINAPKSNGGYVDLSGTSMASPVTAGVAALLLAYHPTLTPAEIKSIIEQTTDKSMMKKKVNRPGGKPRKFFKKKKGPFKDKKVKFATLSKTGGMVDLYAAFQMADTMKK